MTFQRVTKRFGDVVAVADLDLEVADGEFLVLLGPSGCGKSTVLRILAGLEDPTSGRVLIDGRPVEGLAPRDRDVALVFQSYALYPHMTVRKNIAFPLGPRKVSRDEQRRMVDEAAALLGLTDLLDRKPGQLSGGQRQRVALARAIVRRAAVFCMDEPLSNLDAKLRQQTRVDLVALHRRLGATFVYVTHDQVEAMTMADRVAVMDTGRLQQLGTPQEIYDRPNSVFVARFIGTPPMNTLWAEVLDNGVALTLVVGDDPVDLGGRPVPERGPVLVGARAEHVRIAPAGTGVSAAVDGVEALGHEQLVTCSVPDQPERVVVRIDAETPAPAVGERVGLALRPDCLHLFDPGTGWRIDAGEATPTADAGVGDRQVGGTP